MSSVIPTPEVVAQLCAEHDRNTGIFGEGGFAAVACFGCFRASDESRLAEGGEGKVFGGLEGKQIVRRKESEGRWMECKPEWGEEHGSSQSEILREYRAPLTHAGCLSRRSYAAT